MNQRSPYYSLFHPKPLARRVNSFGFPRDLGDRYQIVQKWLGFAEAGQPSNLIAEAQFLHDIFVDILGYKSPFETNGGNWELELHPKPALGFFTETAVNVIAEIRVNTAEEGAIVKPPPEHETTEWLIVLDYREICLYHRDVSGLFCQRFSWESLADLEQLKAFYFVLSRRTLLRGIANSEERSRTSQLLEESHQLEAEVLKNFYSHYYKIRSQLIKDFRYRLLLLAQAPNPHQSSLDNQPQIKIEDAISIAIYQAQKLLNRILFVACCEDRSLLPANLIKDAYEFVNPYVEQPIWENYKAIFSWVQNGNSHYQNPVRAYPFSLFESDSILDNSLFVGDELCRQIKEIARFDFHEDITRHILTCLFDESIKELSQYRKDLGNLSKRRTPKLPCKTILQSESVILTLQQHLGLKKDLVEGDRHENNLQDTLAYCKEYQQRLLNIKILHPKCGAGVFLATALEFLISEHERIHYLLTKFSDEFSKNEEIVHKTPSEVLLHILQHNLFGCDVVEESVEMTRLCLYLRALEINPSLTNFDRNIQLGELTTCDFGEEFQIASDKGELIILK
ncbi:hypothetical protein H6F42_19915 [Pseudanabaena sp. FACHB-1998]|uniref:hypothetical protein n=1 Tax=Pseudanabaena sp. FACHB-1998 TaxID=2692858 RepID=UPI00167FF269|nr:hypothetical protein [Pseudanabaena sp. FACHB-1998]MBD2179193.1 hypothetical protein [Pseudanabaena sp. FACHB-1998]